MRDPRYDVLFEPVQIGPLTAKNRFFQVPHCNGGGYRDPSAAAAMRGIKAEGGWGVVFTEQCEMHHSSEITPFIELRLWEDQDIPGLARMAGSIHEHGALAGIQLAYPGINGPNLYTREVPMADLEKHFDRSYGIFSGPPEHAARLRFTPEMARWVAEETWHTDQAGAFESDGSWLLEVPFSSPRELIMDVMRYGSEVEVLGPDFLREAVATEAERAAEIYRS